MNRRNYVIINGHDSRGITGLLIQELPPIVKPEMRISTEEIDGYNGDIVTELGYSAYDKEMVIGLHDNYDIDEVIEFFSMSGGITFSNELDKVYEFNIYHQIDFERLARFRTATVTLHCQPFKFSSVDRDYVVDMTSLTGKSLTLENYGNVKSRPTFIMTGTGTVELFINGTEVLAFVFPTGGKIAISGSEMEASWDGVLYNRRVIGDYADLELVKGKNTISWTGNLTGLTIRDKSRWL